jgi:hypothetical protein
MRLSRAVRSRTSIVARRKELQRVGITRATGTLEHLLGGQNHPLHHGVE